MKAFNIKVQGDINMINSTIDNFSTTKFQPNDIIFHKVIDTKSNNVLGYKIVMDLIILIMFYPIITQVK